MPRCVGERVELRLTFHGAAAAATGPDSIHVLDDGKVRVVGAAGGRVHHAHAGTEGTLITSGGVRFAIEGEAPADRVCCTGELWEDRHGYPAGVTEGRLADIWWRPAVLRRVGDVGLAIDGYGPGEQLGSTDDWPRGHRSWALQLTVWVP